MNHGANIHVNKLSLCKKKCLIMILIAQALKRLVWKKDKEITCERATTELSSLTASSTIRRLGLSLRRKIAVERSSGLNENHHIKDKETPGVINSVLREVIQKLPKIINLTYKQQRYILFQHIPETIPDNNKLLNIR